MKPRLQSLFERGGKMGRLLRQLDWSTTRLGPPKGWPQEFETTLGICLFTQSPVIIYWGESLEVFYNDPAISLFGPKHPTAALGRPVRQVFPEVWGTLGPIVEEVQRTGQAHLIENQIFLIRRQVAQQELYINATYAPVLNANGSTAGMMLTCLETTESIVGPRRTRLLQTCALLAAGASTADEAYGATLQCLQGHPLDVPVTLLYQVACDGDGDGDGAVATLVGTAGVPLPAVSAAHRVHLQAGKPDPWNFAAAMQHGHALVQGLGDHVAGLPTLLQAARPQAAMVLPVGPRGRGMPPAAFVVAAVSPLQPLNDDYLSFFSLLAGVMGSAANTAQTLAQERARTEQLAALDRVKTASFSNVSHELRTPLTLMLGPTEEALTGADPALRGEALSMVHRNQVRMLKLVNSLLDFSALEAGRSHATLQRTDLAALTAEVAAAFGPVMQAAGLRLHLHCPPLPAPVWVDRSMWEKIVLNLMSNAFKHTHAGSVTVSLQAIDRSIQFSVRDTGEGIAPVDQPKVFERFYRVKSQTSRTHEGTGIGLALVREFIALHAGTVQVASSLGQGSTFTVTLPILQPNHDASQNETPETPRANPARSHAFVLEAEHMLPEANAAAITAARREAAPFIVLADDSADMRRYMTHLLSDYNVVAVGDGHAALQVIRSRRPDLLLSDIMMPRMDGCELLKVLRNDPNLRTLPVILLSARAAENTRIGSFNLHADDYLTKPFSAQELLARIRSQLLMVRLRQAAAVQQTTTDLLAQQHAWLRALFNRVPMPLTLLDPQTGHLSFYNQAFLRMMGDPVPTSPLLDWPAPYQLAQDSGAAFAPQDHPIARAMTHAGFNDAEVLWHTPAGAHHLLLDAQPIQAMPGQAATVLLCMRDVTRMRSVQHELERLVRARDEFLSVASHELKTPLTSLTLQTQMALRRLTRAPEVSPPATLLFKLFQHTDHQLRRLAHLVDDMLDIARIDRGKFTLHREDCDLSHLVQKVLQGLAQQLLHIQPPIEFHPAEHPHGSWDRQRIEQVITHLLMNAARYGAGKPVTVSVATHAQHAALIVQDQGGGIKPEDSERIFGRFERAVSKNEVSGLGLGLYISRQIIDAHGGRLWVENRDPQGARFVMELPLAAP